MGSAGLDLWWLCGGKSRNLSRALKTIADALDGKLHSKAAHLDDIYLSEWDKEERKLRKGHKTYDVALSPSSGAVRQSKTSVQDQRHIAATYSLRSKAEAETASCLRKRNCQRHHEETVGKISVAAFAELPRSNNRATSATFSGSGLTSQAVIFF